MMGGVVYLHENNTVLKIVAYLGAQDKLTAAAPFHFKKRLDSELDTFYIPVLRCLIPVGFVAGYWSLIFRRLREIDATISNTLAALIFSTTQARTSQVEQGIILHMIPSRSCSYALLQTGLAVSDS